MTPDDTPRKDQPQTPPVDTASQPPVQKSGKDKEWHSNNSLPPVPPFQFGRWLLGVAVTAAVIGGMIGAVTILFLPEGIIDIGPGPSPKQLHSELPEKLNAVDRRIAQLEQEIKQKQAEQPASAKDDSEELQALRTELEETASDTRILKEQLTTMQSGTAQESRLDRILIGLTQLRTAQENGEPLQPAIDTLRGVVDDEVIKTLDILNDLAHKTLPSKEKLLEEIRKMRSEYQVTTESDLNNRDLSWRERAYVAFNRFVIIQPSKMVDTKNTLEQLETAVTLDNYPLAAQLIAKLPQGPAMERLKSMVDVRLQTERLTRRATLQISRHLGTGVPY